MDWQKIEYILKDEPKFRIKQVKQLVYRDFISNWKEATTLAGPLREILADKCPLDVRIERTESEANNSSKILISLEDGAKIEAVLMQHKDGRNTVCVSTQVGCPLGCKFCATGKLGLKRDLKAYEIVDQVLCFARILKKKKEKIGGVVYMGMGEPFLNYDNVIESVKILNDKDGINLGIRHISISTAGIVPGIKKLANENMDVNLAISLHAADDFLRGEIMPVNEQYPVREVIAAVDEYIAKTNRRVMFEYLMINGVNDTDECAKELRKLINNKLCFVNLITYNETSVYAPSSRARIEKFKSLLEERGISVTHRFRFGHDIAAACGQLVAKSIVKKSLPTLRV